MILVNVPYIQGVDFSKSIAQNQYDAMKRWVDVVGNRWLSLTGRTPGSFKQRITKKTTRSRRLISYSSSEASAVCLRIDEPEDWRTDRVTVELVFGPATAPDDRWSVKGIRFEFGRWTDAVGTDFQGRTGSLTALLTSLGQAFDYQIDFARALTSSAYHEDKETVLELLSEGLDPNAMDGGGETALSWATMAYDNDEMVSLLLEHGADPNLPNESGETPIFNGASTCPNSVELLLNRGADPNHITPLGRTALAELGRRADRTAHLRAMRLLVDAGADSNASSTYIRGGTVLMDAAKLSDEHLSLAFCEALLDAGADPSQRDSEGKDFVAHAICDSRKQKLVQLKVGLGLAET